MTTFFLAIYNFAWLAALPLLKKASRTAVGWERRTLATTPQGRFDLWIQSASGGESLLTIMILRQLAVLLPQRRRWRVLVTSGTKEGVDILQKGAATDGAADGLEITVSYFPFDAPYLMKKAFSVFAPKLAVIIETELWPGFLVTAERNNVPVLLVNGRMSEKSFRSYRYFTSFFGKYGPAKIFAISKIDGKRFARVFGPEKVTLINNIKFDRIVAGKTSANANPTHAILTPSAPFLVLGSIRKEEEELILTTIKSVLAKNPQCIIGLFPKHIERADRWISQLKNSGIHTVKRSATSTTQEPGTVIVWDTFGELAGAYALAAGAFVGGSLLNLGGQNFLEPLVFGLKPIIGPYWKNFAWVGRDIIDCGLVREVDNETQLAKELLKTTREKASRDDVLQEVHAFFEPRRGGTRQACLEITATLLAGE